MANTNTDLTEEEAADLQFPKGIPCPNSNYFTNNNSSTCANCSLDLITPYINCPKCNVNICTICFSNGAEFSNHKNDHCYKIIRDDFPLFDNTDWTAKEERILLDSLLRYGNWKLVAKELKNRSVSEIKNHYDYFYLQRKGSNQLPMIKETECSIFPPIIVPYKQKITNNDEPPRYSPNTIGYNYLAGYNPARSDFESEYDTNAEDLLTHLKNIDNDDPYSDIIANLQCGIIHCYNRRIAERQRWKQVVRNHGLIMFRKVNAWLHRYDVTITRPVYEKFVRFMQFCTPVKFQFLMEGLHRSGELKVQILRLCDLRQKGITTLADARLYFPLKQLHDKCESELKGFHSNSNLNWRENHRHISSDLPVFKRKVGFTPIDILGMPGYEKLTPSERELCRNIRLVPISYLEFKDILINENEKMGSIKLKTARKLLKIDVNKTRRLYDFLVEEGYITKSVI